MTDNIDTPVALAEDRALRPALAASNPGRLRQWAGNLGGLGVATAAILALFLLFAVAAEWIAPHPFDEISITARLQPPSWQHWMGTDNLGRDILSRVIYGTRGILTTSFLAALLGVAGGSLVGMVSGYIGGWFDEVVMRLTDAFLSIPAILLALLLLTTLGGSRLAVVLGIGIVYTPIVARVVRSAVLAIKGREFISAARLRGENMAYILTREILPNILSPIVVETSVRISYAILLTASFGFLGLGVQEPAPDWGLMVSRGREYIQTAPWMVLFPVAAISLLVVSVSLLADILRQRVAASPVSEEEQS